MSDWLASQQQLREMQINEVVSVRPAHSTAYLIAFGYAYGQMDAEDGNVNTSTYDTAIGFASHWDMLEHSGHSRLSMAEDWKKYREFSR